MLALTLLTFRVETDPHEEGFLVCKGLCSPAEESKPEGLDAEPKIPAGKQGGTVDSRGTRLLRELGLAGHGCLAAGG